MPAKRTSPPAAATTGVPTGAPMSMPRCCPAAYGSVPLRYGVITSPLTGQTHAAEATPGPRGEGRGEREAGGEGEVVGAFRDRTCGCRDSWRARSGPVRVGYSEVSARYRLFALAPVREETTAAAFRGWAPASTSLRRASTRRGPGRPRRRRPMPAAPAPARSRPSAGCRRSGPPARRRCRARSPRAPSSARGRRPPRARDRAPRPVPASPAAGAGTRRRPASRRRVDSSSRSSPFFRGRKPWKCHSSAGSPDATSAVIAADGPGSTSTGRPSATHACTST